MRKTINVFIVIFTLFTLTGDSTGQTLLEKIRQIKVLESTLQDAENLFGKSDEKNFQKVYYYEQIKEGNLILGYSSGNCSSRQNEGWNVPENTIIRILFYPAKKKSFSALGIDKKKLKKVYDESYQIYSNEDEGVTYEVQSGKVKSIEYNPTSKYDYLKCKTISKDKF